MFTYGKIKYHRSPDPDEGGGAGEENFEEEFDFEDENDSPSALPSSISTIANSYLGGGNSADPKGIPAGPSSTSNPENEARLQGEIQSLTQKVGELEGIIENFKKSSAHLENPIVKVAYALAEANETDISALVSKLSGGIPNVNSMSQEDRYEFYVRNKLVPAAGLDDESANRLIRKFNNAEPEDRIAEIIASKEYVEKHRQEAIDKISADLLASKKAPSKAENPNELTEAQIKEADEAFQVELKSILGKGTFNDIDFTEADYKQIDALTKNFMTLWDAKGKPMVSDTIDALHYLLNKKAIRKAWLRQGADLAKGKTVAGLKRVVTQPGNNSQGSKATGGDKYENYIKSLPKLPT